MSRQEQELDAAEYVIGTLSAVERRVFEDLMATDKQTQRDVWYWERAFGALNASISPDAPPAEMWERIEGSLPAKDASRRIPTMLKTKKVKDTKKAEPVPPVAATEDKEPSGSDQPDPIKEKRAEKVRPKKSKIWFSPNLEPAAEPEESVVADEAESQAPVVAAVAPVIEKTPPTEVDNAPVEQVEEQTGNLAGKLRRWRLIALLALLCILGLIGWIFSQTNKVKIAGDGPLSTEQKAKQFLAVVNANGDQPSLVVQINSENGAMRVNPIGILIPNGKSLQLWYRPKDGDRVAVGLLSDAREEFYIAGVEPGGVLEISIEPEGGAPNNETAGPVVYSGALVELNPK